MNGDRGVGVLAQKWDTAEMVDMAVGDEDQIEVGEGDGGADLVTDGGEAIEQLLVALVTGGAAIDEDPLAVVVDEVDVGDELGKGFDLDGIDGAAVGRGMCFEWLVLHGGTVSNVGGSGKGLYEYLFVYGVVTAGLGMGLWLDKMGGGY